MVGLKLALALAALKIEILSDSQLVVRQIQREYEARDEHMAHHLNSVESHLDKLVDWRVKRVPYEKNRKVDALVGVVATLLITKSIMLPIYVQLMPSIASERVHDVAYADVGWMQPIANYFRTGEVPQDEKQAHKLRIQATRFTFINDQLYKWSFGGLYLKCLTDSEAQYVLAKLHEGVCGNHPGE